MDIARPKKSNKRRYYLMAGGVIGIVAVTLAVSQLQPAAPSVERGTLWVDTVKRGPLLLEVRAPGTLVPEHVRIIAALTAGRVEQLPAHAGDAVTPQTLIVELDNPDVRLQALEAQQQLSAAQSQLASLRTQLEQEVLTQEGVVAQVRTEYNSAQRGAAVADALAKKGLSSSYEIDSAKDRASELQTRLDVETKRLEGLKASTQQQLALQQAQINHLRDIVSFQQNRIASMEVRAGDAGQLTELPLELGQWVNPGAELAKVAQPGRLKAQLHVPETQAKDVLVGQKARIDTRNGIIDGHVIRVDPSAQNGTVLVEVALDGKLPPGARPDLSVDGTITIQRLDDVLHVGRPAYGQAESTVGLFRIVPNKGEAVRVNVKLGHASVNEIEVEQGLAVGDSVIISDMSAWDSHDRVRIQ